MRPDLLRLVCSFAAQRSWDICEMDVKCAFLQADGFHRIIYMKPPIEDPSRNYLWRLDKPAYGLADSGRLWWITSDLAIKEFGLTVSTFEPCQYYSKRNQDLAFLLVTQVDNYIYTGRRDIVKRFEIFMQKRFTMGECLHNNFSVYDCDISQNSKGIRVSQIQRLQRLSGYNLGSVRAKMANDTATDAERTAFLSIIGTMIFIGLVTSPILLRIAS